MKDYYSILELTAQASLIDIKKAYRRLALKYHPDSSTGLNAPEKFIDITEAYEVLSNPVSRLQYDRMYTKRSTTSVNESNVGFNQQKQWEESARTKVKEYSSMSFQQFSERIKAELKLNIRYIPRVYLMGFLAVMSIYMLLTLPEMFEKDSIMGVLSIGMIAAMSIGAYSLYKSGVVKYLSERKAKIK